MSLESIVESVLAPFKYIDEQILRQYTKLTLWAEDKKKVSRFKVAGFIQLGNCAYQLVLAHQITNTTDTTLNNNEVPLYISVAASLISSLWVHDVGHTFYNLLKSDSNKQTTEITVDKYNYFSQKIQRTFRLPIIALESYFLYLFGSEIIHGNLNQEGMESFRDVSIYLVSLASCMYIKDADQKILNKVPYWKRVFNHVSEVFSTKPEPVKIPARQHYQIERL